MQEMVPHPAREMDDHLMMTVQIGNVKIIRQVSQVIVEVAVTGEK